MWVYSETEGSKSVFTDDPGKNEYDRRGGAEGVILRKTEMGKNISKFRLLPVTTKIAIIFLKQFSIATIGRLIIINYKIKIIIIIS